MVIGIPATIEEEKENHIITDSIYKPSTGGLHVPVAAPTMPGLPNKPAHDHGEPDSQVGQVAPP